MVTPSAPTLGSVDFKLFFPLCRDAKGELINKEEQLELCDGTDEHLAGHGFLRKVDMDFCDGAVTITYQSQRNPEFYGSMLLDVVATKFYDQNKDEIARINPHFSNYMESSVLTQGLRKISEIFYRVFDRYLEEQTTDEYGLDNVVQNSTIANSKPGFKNFHRGCDSHNKLVTSPDILTGRAGECFKNFVESLPTSLLTPKNKKKAALFLQEGLNQKRFLSDKVLYLKQVLFLLVFQDVLKDSLLELKQSLNMEKDNLYRSANRSHDLYSQSQYIHKRIELIDKTLEQLPINDLLAAIPLACRSSMEELSQDRYFMNYYIKEESLSRECGKARQADIAIRNVLEHSFNVTPKSFSNDGVNSIESYIMGLSGLAISSGLLGRLAMKDHHQIFYKRQTLCSIPSVSDNLPLEFLVTTAQCYSTTNDNWIDEMYLGYIKQMLGAISPYEIEGLKHKIQRVRDIVKNAPVEKLLNGNTLGKDAIKNLQSMHTDCRRNVGLAPLPKSNSSCSIM